MEEFILTMQTNQIKLYSVDTTDLFAEKENRLQSEINYLNKLSGEIESLNSKLEDLVFEGCMNSDEDLREIYHEDLKSLNNELFKVGDELIKKLKKLKCKSIKEVKEKLKNKIGKKNSDKLFTRVLSEDNLTPSKLINQFESSFTRALDVKTNELTKDVFIVEVFHREIMRQILKNGFLYKGEKFIYAFSSAGQIREKRLVMVRESVYNKISPRLYAGLTDDEINEYESKWKDENDEEITVKGMVQGKLIAYKALAASSSIPWEEYKGFKGDKKFDINEVIVVPDVEFEIKDINQDHIDLKFKITHDKVDSIMNPYMDGAGICLPTWNDKNVQVRYPFGKGLVVPFDIIGYAKKEYGIDNPMITDAWGKVWDIKKEEIKVILTCSQFKMWKFFKNEGEITGWDKFKKAFIENGCEFSVVADESLDSKDFKDVKLNYQMLQTLYEMHDGSKGTVNEIELITNNTKSTIDDVGLATRVWDKEITDKTKILGKSKDELLKSKKQAVSTILGFMGINIHNEYKKPLDKALLLHSDLLHDPHVKDIIKNKKTSYVDGAKAGKILLPKSKRVFVIPDITAFADELLGKKVKGKLENKQVSCKLFNDGDELDCLRSPHLFVEHAIRTNVVEDNHPYFITNGIYTSVHDPISKILQFDNDGDELTIVSDKVFVECAKRHVKDLNPISYDLKVGKPVEGNPDNLFESLNKAFDANIGVISNSISKVFNKGKITADDLDAVRLLCARNNAEIDFAKTLWRAKPEDEKAKRLLSLVDYKEVKVVKRGKAKVVKEPVKLPHFFRYAKDKVYKSKDKLKEGEKNQVEEWNNSTVNKISKQFDKANMTNLSFCKGDFDYTVLLNDKDIVVDKKLTKEYQTLIDTNKYKLKKQIKESDTYNQAALIGYIKHELLKLNSNEVEVADMLVKYLYENNHEYKSILWDAVIVNNLEKNLIAKGAARKCKCGEVFKKQGKTIKCNKCRENDKKVEIKHIACRDCNTPFQQKRKTQIRCTDCQKKSEKSTSRVIECRENKGA